MMGRPQPEGTSPEWDGMNEEGEKGTLQIEILDGYIAILRQWKLRRVLLE